MESEELQATPVANGEVESQAEPKNSLGPLNKINQVVDEDFYEVGLDVFLLLLPG